GGRDEPRQGNTERARTDDFSPRLYFYDSDHSVVGEVEKIAKARGAANTQVALAWVLSKSVITAPIVGTSKMAHLDDALAALKIKLDGADVKALEAPYKPNPVLDPA